MREQAAAVGNSGITQWRVGRQRLFFVYVEGSPANPIFSQGTRQRFFVDYRAAGCVNQKRGRLHHTQRLLINQMVGRGWSLAFPQQGNMNADEISIFQSFVQVNILDDGLFAGYATRQAEVLDLLDCADVLM